jgi:hypothetical protein
MKTTIDRVLPHEVSQIESLLITFAIIPITAIPVEINPRQPSLGVKFEGSIGEDIIQTQAIVTRVTNVLRAKNFNTHRCRLYSLIKQV